MKNGNRRFTNNKVNHIYQRTDKGFNIFYSDCDYLVFYTIFSHFAKKCGIQVIGLCIMVDHIHALIIPKSKKQMSEFILLYSSLFARLYNKDKGRAGRLFEKSFGSAPKANDKRVRSAIAYLFNNPVEKKLCKQAEEYRWNFLKYASGQYPFSSDTKLNKASPGLRRAVKIVNICINSKGYLGYQILESIFQKLNIDEKAQIADYIITAFSPFDYNATTAYFGTYDKMVMAINSNTGSEYDIREEYSPDSDMAYGEIAAFLFDKFQTTGKAAIKLPENEKMKLHNILSAQTSATSRQICKFLHLAP